jgi:antitoxin (DNA-binding transcriptional repressor) of toxin-antitoxin stability system
MRMSRTISLREAKQAFARYVRDVEAGAEYVITRNGRTIARLARVGGHRVLSPEQQAARLRARARMDWGWPIGVGSLDRDSLHER